MARARLMTSGLYIIVWNGPDSGALRATWNSSAAFLVGVVLRGRDVGKARLCAGRTDEEDGAGKREDCEAEHGGLLPEATAVREPRLAFLLAAGDGCMVRPNDER